MQTRRANILPALAIAFGLCHVQLAAAQRLPSFEQVYRSNDPHDLTAWASRYEHGVGIGQDTMMAVRLYCKAAEKGDNEAKFHLGQIYAFGPGIERDKELAAAWFYEAAQGKDRRASSLLQILKIEGKPKRRAACALETGTTIATRPHPATGEVAQLVRSLAPRYALDPNLVLALIEAESGFDPKAVSPKNAQGLMQLIPATAERFGVRDVWDPEQNLRGGMAYLRWLLDRFDGDVKLALAGYNAGEKAVDKHGGIPPFEETQAYVTRIIRRIGVDERPESS